MFEVLSRHSKFEVREVSDGRKREHSTYSTLVEHRTLNIAPLYFNLTLSLR
jgi:hypothetical protein